jgi:hypothetical protein
VRLLLVILLAGLGGLGCQTRCSNNFDCGDGSFCIEGRCETECFTDQDCREPPECQGNPTACRPKGLKCSALGRCVGPIIEGDPGFVEGLQEDFIGVIEGFDDLPGSGTAFVVDSINLAERDTGFDIDGACTDEGCIDNLVGDIGRLSNRQINQGIRAGESLLLLELAGLDDPYQGNEQSMTLKVYGGTDADQPPNSTNNFETPPGRSECCEFRISPQSLLGTPPQATARSPARIVRGRLESLAPVPIQFVITIGTPPHPEVRIVRTRFRAVVPADLRKITQGLLGGAIPMRTLGSIENPYCRAGFSSNCPATVPDSSRLIDLVSVFAGPTPDIDLDGDGLECAFIDPSRSLVGTCCDGEGRTTCPFDGSFCNQTVGVPDGAINCAQNPAMADAYSVGITFTAVAASIVGVAQ